jgi:membrane protein implicated in regulation of membrane protease activity
MTWWLWMLTGLTLLGLEILSGGFYLMFFGLAALAVGVVVVLGVSEPGWLQWVLFSVLSIASLLLFRGPLLRAIKAKDHTHKYSDSLVGEVATLLEDLSPGSTGKAELRGATWTVRNGGEATLIKGQRSRVVRVEGLTLWITGE